MKIQTKNTRTKLLVAVIVILVSSLIAGVAFAYIQKVGPFHDPRVKSTSEEEMNTGSSIKKQSLEQSENSNSKTGTGSDPGPAPAPSPTGGKPTVGMEITAANQNDSTVNIRTLIQSVTSTGTCTLTMAGPNNNTYTATTDVQAQPSTSTCMGFDISTSELMTGDWKIVINFENNEVQGSATKEIAIK